MKKNKKLENSIRNLINLYTVVIGVALSIAVVGAIDANSGLTSVDGVQLSLFVCFLVTLLPFFHGALRHLDDAYLEDVTPNIKTSALIIDFALLFLHALAFVLLSQLLSRPAHFAWILIAILAIDVVWGVFTHYVAPSARSGVSPELRWTFINFIFCAFVVIYLVINEVTLEYAGDELKLAIVLSVACVVRSVTDYVWCRALYFPTTER